MTRLVTTFILKDIIYHSFFFKISVVIMDSCITTCHSAVQSSVDEFRSQDLA
jgi:hypothetical protein